MPTIQEAKAEWSSAIDSAVAEYDRRISSIHYTFDVGSITATEHQQERTQLRKTRDEAILEAASRYLLRLANL
jgi:hypothetical protein